MSGRSRRTSAVPDVVESIKDESHSYLNGGKVFSTSGNNQETSTNNKYGQSDADHESHTSSGRRSSVARESNKEDQYSKLENINTVIPEHISSTHKKNADHINETNKPVGNTQMPPLDAKAIFFLVQNCKFYTRCDFDIWILHHMLRGRTPFELEGKLLKVLDISTQRNPAEYFNILDGGSSKIIPTNLSSPLADAYGLDTQISTANTSFAASVDDFQVFDTSDGVKNWLDCSRDSMKYRRPPFVYSTPIEFNDQLYRITPDTVIYSMSHRYRIAFVIDLSPSSTITDSASKRARSLATVIFETICKCLEGICRPFQFSSDIRNNNVLIYPQICITVLTDVGLTSARPDISSNLHEYCKAQPVRFILQDVIVTPDNLEFVTEMIYDGIAAVGDELVDMRFRDLHQSPPSSNIRASSTKPVSDSSNRNIYDSIASGLFALDMMQLEMEPVLIMISDGVISQNGTGDVRATDCLRKIARGDVRFTIIQVGSAKGFIPDVNFGHVGDVEFLRYLAICTGGRFLYSSDCHYMDERYRIPLVTTNKIDEDGNIINEPNPFNKVGLPNFYHKNLLFRELSLTKRIPNPYKHVFSGRVDRVVDIPRERFLNAYMENSATDGYSAAEDAFPWSVISKPPVVTEILCEYRDYSINTDLERIVSSRLHEGFKLKNVKAAKRQHKGLRVEINMAYNWLPYVTIMYTLKTSWTNLKRPLLHGRQENVPAKVEINIFAQHNFAILFINFRIRDISTQKPSELSGIQLQLYKLHLFLMSICNADEDFTLLSSFNSGYALSVIPHNDDKNFNIGTADVDLSKPILQSRNENVELGTTNFWFIISHIFRTKPLLFTEWHINVILRPIYTHGFELGNQRRHIADIYLKQVLSRNWASFTIEDGVFIKLVYKQHETDDKKTNDTPSGFCWLHMSALQDGLASFTLMFFRIQPDERRKIVEDLEMRINSEQYNLRTGKGSVSPLITCNKPLSTFLIVYDTVSDRYNDVKKNSSDKIRKTSLSRQKILSTIPLEYRKDAVNQLVNSLFASDPLIGSHLRHYRWTWETLDNKAIADSSIEETNSKVSYISSELAQLSSQKLKIPLSWIGTNNIVSTSDLTFWLIYFQRLSEGFIPIREVHDTITLYREDKLKRFKKPVPTKYSVGFVIATENNSVCSGHSYENSESTDDKDISLSGDASICVTNDEDEELICSMQYVIIRNGSNITVELWGEFISDGVCGASGIVGEDILHDHGDISLKELYKTHHFNVAKKIQRHDRSIVSRIYSFEFIVNSALRAISHPPIAEKDAAEKAQNDIIFENSSELELKVQLVLEESIFAVSTYNFPIIDLDFGINVFNKDLIMHQLNKINDEQKKRFNSTIQDLNLHHEYLKVDTSPLSKDQFTTANSTARNSRATSTSMPKSKSPKSNKRLSMDSYYSTVSDDLYNFNDKNESAKFSDLPNIKDIGMHWIKFALHSIFVKYLDFITDSRISMNNDSLGESIARNRGILSYCDGDNTSIKHLDGSSYCKQNNDRPLNSNIDYLAKLNGILRGKGIIGSSTSHSICFVKVNDLESFVLLMLPDLAMLEHNINDVSNVTEREPFDVCNTNPFQFFSVSLFECWRPILPDMMNYFSMISSNDPFQPLCTNDNKNVKSIKPDSVTHGILGSSSALHSRRNSINPTLESKPETLTNILDIWENKRLITKMQKSNDSNNILSHNYNCRIVMDGVTSELRKTKYDNGLNSNELFSSENDNNYYLQTFDADNDDDESDDGNIGEESSKILNIEHDYSHLSEFSKNILKSCGLAFSRSFVETVYATFLRGLSVQTECFEYCLKKCNSFSIPIDITDFINTKYSVLEKSKILDSNCLPKIEELILSSFSLVPCSFKTLENEDATKYYYLSNIDKSSNTKTISSDEALEKSHNALFLKLTCTIYNKSNPKQFTEFDLSDFKSPLILERIMKYPLLETCSINKNTANEGVNKPRTNSQNSGDRKIMKNTAIDFGKAVIHLVCYRTNDISAPLSAYKKDSLSKLDESRRILHEKITSNIFQQIQFLLHDEIIESFLENNMFSPANFQYIYSTISERTLAKIKLVKSSLSKDTRVEPFIKDSDISFSLDIKLPLLKTKLQKEKLINEILSTKNHTLSELRKMSEFRSTLLAHGNIPEEDSSVITEVELDLQDAKPEDYSYDANGNLLCKGNIVDEKLSGRNPFISNKEQSSNIKNVPYWMLLNFGRCGILRVTFFSRSKAKKARNEIFNKIKALLKKCCSKLNRQYLLLKLSETHQSSNLLIPYDEALLDTEVSTSELSFARAGNNLYRNVSHPSVSVSDFGTIVLSQNESKDAGGNMETIEEDKSNCLRSTFEHKDSNNSLPNGLKVKSRAGGGRYYDPYIDKSISNTDVEESIGKLDTMDNLDFEYLTYEGQLLAAYELLSSYPVESVQRTYKMGGENSNSKRHSDNNGPSSYPLESGMKDASLGMFLYNHEDDEEDDDDEEDEDDNGDYYNKNNIDDYDLSSSFSHSSGICSPLSNSFGGQSMSPQGNIYYSHSSYSQSMIRSTRMARPISKSGVHSNETAYKLQPGQFQCPFVCRIVFPLHWRVTGGAVLKHLALSLQPLAILNRKNMFVVNHNEKIYYARLSSVETKNDAVDNMNGLLYDTTVAFGRTKSRLSSVTNDSSNAFAQRRSSVGSSSSGMEINVSWVQLEMFGIETPTEYLKNELMKMILLKIVAYTCEVFNVYLGRNIQPRLSFSDVQFLLPFSFMRSDIDPKRIIWIDYLHKNDSQDKAINENDVLEFASKVSNVLEKYSMPLTGPYVDNICYKYATEEINHLLPKNNSSKSIESNSSPYIKSFIFNLVANSNARINNTGRNISKNSKYLLPHFASLGQGLATVVLYCDPYSQSLSNPNSTRAALLVWTHGSVVCDSLCESLQHIVYEQTI